MANPFTKLINAPKSTLKHWLRTKNSHPKQQFLCPLCNMASDRFHPLPSIFFEKIETYHFLHGLDKFETLELDNYICPHCHASDRDRLYSLYLKRYQQENAVSSPYLLDIAPSTALSNWIKKQQYFRYRSCDLFMENVDDKGVDITDMKLYRDGSFDCVICSHVLEHVPDDKKAIKELYRIIAPHGWAIIMAPISLVIDSTIEYPSATTEEARWHYFAQGDHVRLYSKAGFLELLQYGRFKVETHTIAHFDNYAFRKHAIDPKSVLYIAKKSNIGIS